MKCRTSFGSGTKENAQDFTRVNMAFVPGDFILGFFILGALFRRGFHPRAIHPKGNIFQGELHPRIPLGIGP